jgi:flagellar biosynthesis GTPase FlhF
MSAFFGRNPNGGNRAPKKTVQKETPEFTDFEPFISAPEENKKDSQEESAPKTEVKPESNQETSNESEKKEEGENQETEKQDTEAEKAIEAEQENQENKPPVEADKPTSESTQPSEPSGEEPQASTETSEETEKKPAETEETKAVNIADDIEEVKSEEADDFGEPDLAEYFFDFLNAEELNVTLVGYFCRFFNILLVRRTTEVHNLSHLTSRLLNIFGPDLKL